VDVKKIGFKVGFLILVLAAIGACADTTEQKESEKQKAEKPAPEEIREFEETKLSSVNDFRENSIKGPQYVDKDKYRLTISGLVDSVRVFTYDEIIGRENKSKMVTLNCVEGWSVTILWEGVLVRELIEEAGVKPKANTVIFYADDGYSTSFPLSYIRDNDIIMAYKMNGLTIPPERGFPFELVAEGKWGYKWIKWINKIELSDDQEYRGYWESRGYSNDGDLDKGFFEKR
jgi:DMSO/TMAO reductase YedYZ molybdopterin-dependent catalytic subunit